MTVIWWCPACKREVAADDVVRDRHLVIEWDADTMMMDRIWHPVRRQARQERPAPEQPETQEA